MDSAPELAALASRHNTTVQLSGDQAFVEVPSHSIVAELKSLWEQGWKVLADLTAVDELGRGAPSRFTVVYQLMHVPTWRRLRLKSRVPADTRHPTVTGVFEAANFAEREVYDMFGIRFDGHPNLKRFLCPDDFEGFPLRKDFPLKGRGYRDDFPNYHRDLLEKTAES
ncbi:MAG: NADH-quinone oxidoreductase subunit C [Planctomycetota bacterium]